MKSRDLPQSSLEVSSAAAESEWKRQEALYCRASV